MSKRIIVTGMGAVSPLDCGVESIWQRLLAGQSGTATLPAELIGDLLISTNGQVPDRVQDPQVGFDPDLLLAAREQRKMDRFIPFTLTAAQEALAQAGWAPQNVGAQEHTATVIASGVGGFYAIAEAMRITDGKGPRRLSSFTVPSFLCNMAAAHVPTRHGFKGPLGAPVTACAAGIQAIGDAARMIRAGEVDMVLCGGAEATIHRVNLAGFAAARVLSSDFNDSPERASRPFDQARDGFVMGEGAGLLVIKELEHALARGTRPITELMGYGTSSDAYHMTTGLEDGSDARWAMQQALRQTGVEAAAVQHLNAHVTSTQVGDKGKLAATKAMFGAGSGLAISATRSAIGHLLGAADDIEAISIVLALRDQLVPTTLNLETPDTDAEGLDLVRGEARRWLMEHTLFNGFGSGGVNASLLSQRWVQRVLLWKRSCRMPVLRQQSKLLLVEEHQFTARPCRA